MLKEMCNACCEIRVDTNFFFERSLQNVFKSACSFNEKNI